MKIQIAAIFLVTLTVAGSELVRAAAPAGAPDKGKPAPASPAAGKTPAPAPTPAAAKPNPTPSPAPKPSPAPTPPPPAKPAPPPTPPKDKLVSLQVTPAKFVLQGKWSLQTLVVIGRFADGTARDVTSVAEYKSSNGQIAAVGKEGIVQPIADGEAVISITAKSAGYQCRRGGAGHGERCEERRGLLPEGRHAIGRQARLQPGRVSRFRAGKRWAEAFHVRGGSRSTTTMPSPRRPKAEG